MNKQIKRVALAALSSTLLLSASQALAASKDYPDVPSDHWAYDVVTKWSDQGVLFGNDDGTFAPSRSLNLAELSAIFARYFEYTERTEAEVLPTWADEDVEKAIAAGILDAEEQIDAGIIVSREAAARYFALAFGIDPVEGATTFDDDASIGELYKPYVNALQRLGYINGMENNNFAPQSPFTRAEAVQILDNLTLLGIQSIHTIGYMANDGVKLNAIAVEYNVDLTGTAVKPSDYAVSLTEVAWNANSLNYGDGEIGDIVKAYVNSEPVVSESGGDGKGQYVILEMYTDYFYSTEQSAGTAMSAGVTQTGVLTADGKAIAPGKEVINYTLKETTNMRGDVVISKSAVFDSYTITGLDGYKYYTNMESDVYPADGPAFTAEKCFNEQSGLYESVDVSYALYLPENYQEDGTYAMVVVDHPASTVHPYEMVRTSRGPSALIDEKYQQLVQEEHGLDGLIVVVPVVESRVGDNSATPAAYSGLVQLWDYLIETYNVDEDHVYGIGQSVGGMILVETNTKRDNYFAGILMYDNQWGSNYYKDEVFARGMMTEGYNETAANTPRHYPSIDGTIIWDYYLDEEGNKVYEDVDPNNYYWMVSDDNILITNSWTGNWISRNTWTEQQLLYQDLTGYEIPIQHMDFTAGLDEQNAQVAEFLTSENQQGIYWLTFDGGSNMVTPIWTRRLDAPYEWLLKQDRQDEIARAKLDLNKPFELADEQIQDESRLVQNFVNADGEQYYFVTGKEGSGTKFYNTGWYNMGNNATADRVPGWLPEGMEHPVSAAAIESVSAINGEDGTLIAVAIQYDTDMENLVIHLKGDNVIDSKGNIREDDLVVLDPYEFYDEDGNLISAAITNVYVNDSASIVSEAERESGSGCYVIVELDTESNASSVGVKQITTVRTNLAIASASMNLWK